MSHDLFAIKERLSLLDVFRRDGLEPRRMGSGWFVCCPFHDEKTPSCKVEEKKFHCFGCGAGTDVFDYWERSRGLSKKDSIEQLASLAGIAPLSDGYTRPIARPAPRIAPEEVIPPLTAEERADWFACVDRLRRNSAEIARIASWRGISEDVIRWALDRGIIGLKKWMGQLREAFLVEMPESPGGPLIPVATHIRLAPHTRGNPRDKAAWHFDPKQRGAWPLIIGDHATATHLFLMEGQWDALALVHLMGWHRTWPPTACIIAMRGSTSFRKLLSHYALHEKSTAFAIADADQAGSKWFEPDGLVHQLSAKVRTVHSFWPGIPGADFNDLVHHHGLTRDALIRILSPKLRSRRHAAPTGPTFYTWCKSRTSAPEPIGRAARLVCADPTRPSGRPRASMWERHWRKLNLPPDVVADLRHAWETYHQECATVTA